MVGFHVRVDLRVCVLRPDSKSSVHVCLYGFSCISACVGLHVSACVGVGV